MYGTDDLSESKFVGWRTPEGKVQLGVDLVDLVDVVKAGIVLRLRDGGEN
jgi:hypothetical protein